MLHYITNDLKPMIRVPYCFNSFSNFSPNSLLIDIPKWQLTQDDCELKD
jgi:hypothetical protein